jgi:hypothetical protein
LSCAPALVGGILSGPRALWTVNCNPTAVSIARFHLGEIAHLDNVAFAAKHQLPAM